MIKMWTSTRTHHAEFIIYQRANLISTFILPASIQARATLFQWRLAGVLIMVPFHLLTVPVWLGKMALYDVA